MSAITDAIKEQFSKQNDTIKKLADEVTAARKLLWAAIYMNNSEVKVPDHVMAMTQNNQELECFYDKERRETVMRSKVSIPKFTPSSIVPDKDGCQDEQSQKFDTDQSHT